MPYKYDTAEDRKRRNEILTEIQRRSAEQKRRIAAGEVLVCSKERPMPADRDQMGQAWYHQDAKPDGTDDRMHMTMSYLCPNCNLTFPVTIRRILPNAR